MSSNITGLRRGMVGDMGGRRVVVWCVDNESAPAVI